MKTTYTDKLQNWIKSYWGLDLVKNGGPGSIPYAPGAWMTGWTLSGHFPGSGMDWKRFNSLHEVAAYVNYPNR